MSLHTFFHAAVVSAAVLAPLGVARAGAPVHATSAPSRAAIAGGPLLVQIVKRAFHGSRPSFADHRVPEIAVPGLADTAMARMTWSGPVILYEPELYRAAGDAREFVRAHEYGHVLLHHLENEHMISTEEGRAEAEAEADCFAALGSSPRAVLSMVALLRRRGPEARDAIYGTKPERARRILACAGMYES
jgi:hypothetical protein